MRPDQFRDFIRELRNGYGLTMYRGKQGEDSEILDFLYDKAGQSIPGEAVPWMTEKFHSGFDKFPVKLHTALLWTWNEWRKEHPEKRSFTSKVNCKECEDGLIFTERPEPEMGYMAQYVFVCSVCNQATDNYPSSNWRELKMRGHEPRQIRTPVKNENYKPTRAATDHPDMSAIYAELAKVKARMAEKAL